MSTTDSGSGGVIHDVIKVKEPHLERHLELDADPPARQGDPFLKEVRPEYGRNGYATPNDDFGIGITSGDNNLIEENTAYGNTNGIVIFPAATNTRVRGNVAVGNPPVLAKVIATVSDLNVDNFMNKNVQ